MRQGANRVDGNQCADRRAAIGELHGDAAEPPLVPAGISAESGSCIAESEIIGRSLKGFAAKCGVGGCGAPFRYQHGDTAPQAIVMGITYPKTRNIGDEVMFPRLHFPQGLLFPHGRRSGSAIGLTGQSLYIQRRSPIRTIR